MKRINLVGFENAVNALQRSLKGGARRSLAQHRLYDELIAPFENDLQDVKQLTILSDGNLNKVPFGALLDRDDMFLISKFAITYSYSLRGLDDESLSRISPILTVAPVFDGTDDRVVDKSTRPSDFAETLIPLNESLYEIDSIASMYEKLDYPYTVLASCYATKSNFLEASKNNAIIHIATHGISTKQQESGLYFYPISEDVKDFFLPLSELYTMDIDADLVVLSACQTAVGEIKDGEGVMSLPRGFIYAGASNVMASLWQVNDAKTKYMMVQFYKHLIQDSCSYSLALQKAKIDCVNRGFLPIDWAGFILVSD